LIHHTALPLWKIEPVPRSRFVVSFVIFHFPPFLLVGCLRGFRNKTTKVSSALTCGLF